jgi:hypothetical protein
MEGKAEREGFEPPETCASTVFPKDPAGPQEAAPKTAAFDRSAILK